MSRQTIEIELNTRILDRSIDDSSHSVGSLRPYTLRFIFVVLWVIVSTMTSANDDGWLLVKTTAGIKIFSRQVMGSSVNEVRAIGRVRGSVDSIVKLLRDVDARAQWDSYCGEAFIHKIDGPTEEWVYLHKDLPWPISDRDMLLHITWTKDPRSGSVRMESSATTGVIPNRKGRVRITEGRQSWQLTPTKNGEVEVTTDIYLDPGGPLPGWLLNKLAIDAPLDALKRIRAIVN